MGLTEMKKMKQILSGLVAATLIFSVSCSTDSGNADVVIRNDGYLKSFRLTHEGKIHLGKIDGDRIYIGGIEYGSYVSGYKADLVAGVTMTPESLDEYIENWPQEVQFTLTDKTGQTKTYTVVLSSFLGLKPDFSSEANILYYTDFDEVDGIPDPSVWTLCQKGSSSWNKRMSGSYDHAYVDDGNLVLKAEIVNGEYKTGGIDSKGKKSFRNARVDIRAKFVKIGRGSFPALWMMPQNPLYTGWPNYGEIDIMEQLSNQTMIHQTLHTHYKNTLGHTEPHPGTTSVQYNVGEYNTFSVSFDDENIIYYVNDVESFRYGNLHLETEAEDQQWPFSTDWYLILNYALGGEDSWAGPIYDADLPFEMRVDWIKVTSLVNIN